MHALVIFAAGTAAASLLASWLLVSRLERIGGAAGPVRGAAGNRRRTGR